MVEPIKTGDFEVQYEIQIFDNLPLHPEGDNGNDICEIVPENRKAFVRSDSLKIHADIKGIQISYFIKDESRAKKVRQKIEEPQGSIKLSSHSFKSGSKSQYLEADKLVYPTL